MEILPPLQATLNLVAFLANLIDLNQFNTILVLHDQHHRDQINLIIENLQPRYDVAWILVNEFKNLEKWNHAIIKDRNILILTAVQQQNIVPLLMPLYNTNKLNPRSKNLIVTSDISKLVIKTLPRIENGEVINAVFVDSTHAEVKIYAWNPKKGEQSIELNETEFLCASNADLTNRKYSGVFFDQLQSLNGQETIVLAMYDTRHVYNVISKDSVAGIDGTVIRMADFMGEALQSPIKFSVLKMSTLIKTHHGLETIIYKDYFERTYKTFESVQLRQFEIICGSEYIVTYMHTTLLYSESYLVAGGIITNSFNDQVYPHGIENYVIIVENNMTTTATAIERIFTSPVIYFWTLLILVFVVFRCGLQWLYESNVTNTARKRQRCVFMCQDTVQLSCGVVMNTKIFQSDRYGHSMLAHGATIIPLVAGIFFSGLLYGEYLIHSEVPNIDSIEQLERSNLTIYGGWKPRLKNDFVESQFNENLNMIWSGDTRYAYVIPERWTRILNMDHLQRNGRPLFHVVKEPYDVLYPSFAARWYLQNRLNTIVMRLQEHGFVNHFESISKLTAREMPSNTVDLNTVVAEAGGLQELLIACVIYLVGMLCGILVFILELFSKRTSK